MAHARIAVVVTITLACTSSAIAQHELLVSSDSQFFGTFTPLVNDFDSQRGPTGPISVSATSTGIGARGEAYDYQSSVLATFGFARLQTSASVSPTSSSRNGSGSASAVLDWSDTVNINPTNPANIGTVADWTFSFAITGASSAVDPSGQNRALTLWNLQMSTDISSSPFYAAQHDPNTGYTGDPFGIYQVTLQVTLGHDTPFVGNILAYSDSSNIDDGISGARTSEMNLLNTFQWLGTDSVKIGSTDVTYSSISSSSGADWESVIVPSPSTGLALILGLSLATRRR
ncbi:MAG: hypothetical protein ACF8GE_00720 [Phycisphaerales bacterium JB043]